MWNLILKIIALVIIGLEIYNIWSLIRKWKAYPNYWFDLLVGIVIWTIAIGGLVLIILKYLPK